MKNFVFLHYGFETPTPAIMEAWNTWFASIGDKFVDRGKHFVTGREISHAGTKDLPLGKDSLTGYNIIRADSLAEAEKIAQSCPFIDSIRVYEAK